MARTGTYIPGSGPRSDVDGEPRPDERLVTGYTGRILLTVSIGYLVIQFGRNILSPLLPDIMESLAISSVEAGLALTVIGFTYAFSQFPGGRLSDQLSRKTIIVLATVVATAGYFVLFVTRSYPPFLVAAAVISIGAGLYWISLRALMADLFVARRGQAFGLQDALGFAGPLLAAGGAVVAVALGSWRLGFPPVVAALLLIGLCTHRWLREPYVVTSVEFDFVATGRRVFADVRIRWLVIAYTAVVFSMQAVLGFLPVYLQVERGYSTALSSLGFALLFVGAMVSMPLAGSLGDRIDYTPVAIGGVTVAIAGLVLTLFAPGVALVMIGVLGFAAGTFAFPPVIQAYLMTLFPDGSMGGDYGAFKTVYAGVGSLGPTYVGVVAAAFSYTAAFAGLGLLLVGAIYLLARHV